MILLILNGFAPQTVLLTQLPRHHGPLHLAFFSPSIWPADGPRESPFPVCSIAATTPISIFHETTSNMNMLRRQLGFGNFYPPSAPLRLQHRLVTPYRQAQRGLWWKILSDHLLFAVDNHGRLLLSLQCSWFRRGWLFDGSAAHWAVQNIQWCSAIFKHRGVDSPM